MLDRLLGRASLNARIDELEAENERLQKRYEAESERRADAATARQDAEERVNRLEDRIAQLEGELERVDADETELTVRRRDQLRGPGSRWFSTGWRPSERGRGCVDRQRGRRGARIGPCGSGRRARRSGRARRRRRAVSVLRRRRRIARRDARAADHPDVDAAWRDRFALEREWFLPTGRHAVALVRTDLFAVGVYEGDERVDYRGFESDVKGSHSKGGFRRPGSSGFATDRSTTTSSAVATRCRRTNRGRTGRHAVLYLVGQRGTVDALVDESGLEPTATAAVDATGEPKAALADAVRSFYGTTEMRVLTESALRTISARQ